MASIDSTQRRLWSILNTALTVGAATAALFAICVVVGLFWWAYSLPPSGTGVAHTRHGPVFATRRRPRPAVSQQVAKPAPPAAQRQPPVSAQHVPPVAAKVARRPAAAQRAAAAPVPTHGANSDLAKNRAIGKSLKRLAQDPDFRKKLGIDASELPP